MDAAYERKPLSVPFAPRAGVDGVRTIHPGDAEYEKAFAHVTFDHKHFGVPIPYASDVKESADPTLFESVFLQTSPYAQALEVLKLGPTPAAAFKALCESETAAYINSETWRQLALLGYKGEGLE